VQPSKLDGTSKLKARVINIEPYCPLHVDEIHAGQSLRPSENGKCCREKTGSQVLKTTSFGAAPSGEYQNLRH